MSLHELPPAIAERRDEVITALEAGPHDHIDAGPAGLAHWSFGQGPALIFVHGWPLHGATWRELVPWLMDQFTCHVFDMPGVGRSSWPEGEPVGLWPNARALHAAVMSLGPERYALVAHDSGATITRLMATLDPDGVVGLIMGNTEIPGHVPRTFVLGQKLAQMPGAEAMMRLVSRSKRWQRSGAGFAGSFLDQSRLEGDFHDWFIAPLHESPEHLKGQLRYVRGLEWDVVRNLDEVHRQIEAPVLMIWGERDPFFPLELARPMVQSFAGPARLETLPDARLFVHEELAEAFAELARPFLEELFRG